MVPTDTHSKGDDNPSNDPTGRTAIIVRKADLDKATENLNDLITLVLAEITSPSNTAREMRKIYQQLRNLQTKKTGTARP